MRQRLERIKTTYNEQGDYDHDLYYRQQKQIYKREIDFAIKYDEITEDQFTLKPLQIGFMTSTALKDEQKFKDIKKMLQDYNKSVLESGGAAQNGLHLKKVVMDSMLKFMRLMMLAPDTPTKKTILEIAYHWFIKHLDPKSVKKTTKQLQQQIKQIIIQKKLLPIDIVNRELILNRVNQQLHPYKIKARTMYKELDDPKYELQNYNTHKLQFMGERKENQQKNKPRKWIDTVKFPKIQPYSYQIQQIPQQKNDQQAKKQQTGLQPKKQDPSLPPLASPQPPKLDADGKPIEVQPGQQGQQGKPPQNANQQNQQELDFGQPAQGEPEAPEQEEQQPEEKKRGKLDPLLKVFLLERIRSKEKGQVACQKVRRKQMNKNNLTYEEDFMSGEYLREWARKRARLKSQIAKKTQSTRGYNKISKTRLNQTQTFLQTQMDKLKVKNNIQQYKKNITTVDVPPDKLNSQASLSLFDRRRVKTQSSRKPFSSILSEYSRKQEENTALSEISDIKEKFSKYKLFTPLDKLIKGLAPPDKQYIQDSDKIVWPNSQMLSNPFIKVSKKKKKKKKKK